MLGFLRGVDLGDLCSPFSPLNRANSCVNLFTSFMTSSALESREVSEPLLTALASGISDFDSGSCNWQGTLHPLQSLMSSFNGFLFPGLF